MIMTNLKRNLKGQFNNSQTAVNPDGLPTVNRRSRLLSVLCLLTLLTFGVGNVWGRTIYLNYDNLTWYLNNNCATVHAWGGSSTQDVVLSWIEGNIATCTINDDQTNICFYRYYSSSWHDQTVDCTISDNKNYWKISSSKDGEKYKIDTYDRYSQYGAVVGDFNSWNPDANPFGSGSTSTINISLSSSSNTSFKILYKEAYYGNTGTITNSVSNWVFETSKDNCTITPAFASSAQNYSFKWENSTKKISVTYPTSHTITYGVGTNKGCSSVSVSPYFTSGRRVVASESITFSKTATNSGYSWKGWYNAAGGSGTNWQSTDANYTSNSRTDNVYVYACYDLINYNITYNLNGGSGASNSTYNVTTSTITLPTAPTVNKTGYTFDGWYFESNFSGTRQTQITKGSTGDKAYYAKWDIIWYTITYELNGGSKEDIVPWNPDTHSVEQNVTINVAPTKEGYDFDGWYTNDALTTPAGSPYAISIGSTGDKTFYAKWTPKSYTVTLDVDEANKGDISGATLSQSVTYNGATTTVSNRPHAANGYGLYGYYTSPNGEGTKVINADGTWIASVAGYTDAEKKWIHDDNVTLYAYYRQAAITGFTFSPPSRTVAAGGSLTVTPNIDPTPEGTTTVCWRVLYSNGNPLEPENQPIFTPGSGATVSFPAPATSGTYKVEATLHLGGCEGTVLSTAVQNFQVAGEHTVTVQYKCGSETIKPSTTVTGKPLEWSEKITPPDIFGYTFLRWVAEDGVSINDGTTTVDSTTTSTIKIKANYNGRLLARYTQKRIIYFKNTLGWSNVYVNLLDGDYWGSDGNAQKGTGNKNKANKNLAMTRIGETDVWYYEYGNKSTTQYVSFTQESMDDYEFFSQNSPNVAHVVFPTRNSDALTTNKNNDNGFYAGTPMFVPRAGQTGVKQNNDRAEYYNDGYWTKYTPGTGYILRIYNEAGNTLLKTIEFTSTDELMPMTVVSDLEASTTYKYELLREGDVYYGNANTMTFTDHGQGTPWEMTWKSGGHKAGLTTNAAGDYTFHLTYSADNSSHYRLRMAVDYPIKDGDYRVIYKDDVHTNWHPSAIVPQVNNGKDTVSFFIRPDQTPVMKIQQATVNASTGSITWSAGTDITSQLTAVRCPKDSVYNICLTMDGSGAISVENVEAYTGYFYIRTDAAPNKWDNYKNSDHMMTYSEYSEKNSDYTHYYVKHVNGGTNVKFVVANDYSPCISDTLIQQTHRGGDASHVDKDGFLTSGEEGEANVRFMWHRHTNAVYRAYLAPAKLPGSKFLVLRGEAGKLLSESGTALTGESYENQGNNRGAGANCIQFVDDENWIYETMVRVKPSSWVKLYAKYHGSDFYYKGNSSNEFNGTKDGEGVPNAIQLITGNEDGDPQLVRVIYDFKTDRLIAALLPSGTYDHSEAIHADVMFFREDQGEITSLNFTESGAITDIKTAYGVMRFNKWTLNNKQTTGTHLPVSAPLSPYERSLFFISFPFRVKLNEVFGFGTYGTHWIIQYYDGAARAANGMWAETGTYWKYVWDRRDFVLEPNQGYLLALDLDLLGVDAEVWGVAENERAELFFPSYGAMPNITSAAVNVSLPEHTCTINRTVDAGGNPTGLPGGNDVRTTYDRRIVDSHWNVMGVPTYANTSSVRFTNHNEWINEGDGKRGPKFLYTWNADDNTLTATAGSGYTYKAMHAYMVQYHGDISWSASSGSPYPSSIVARRTYAEQPRNIEFCLEIQQNEKMIDRTYVDLSDDEETSIGFKFDEDMTKDFSGEHKTRIYTIIEGDVVAAGNTLPMTEQITVVPVGVTIKTAGEYTFAMPDGTKGVGVTLVDTEANVRTSLSALDYTVSLEAGEYTGRFVLEISPIQNMPTDIEAVSVQPSEVRKVMMDGRLYIVKDGKMYDARGASVE